MSGAKVLLQLQKLQPVFIDDISRNTNIELQLVTQSLDRLIDIGVPIEWTTDASVCLLKDICPLDSARIIHEISLTDRQISNQITVLEEVDSTNEFLLKLAAQQPVHKHICVAEYMSSGRGRQRKKWFGGAYQNIMLSFGWQLNESLSQFSGISLAVAVMVVECLHQTTGIKTEVKWPNDILFKNKKLGGILIEINKTTVVIGIGINCDLSNDELSMIESPTASLSDLLQVPVDRTQLVVELIRKLNLGLELFSREKFEPFRDRWMKLHAYAGKKIIAHGKTKIEGRAIGVDRGGSLLLQLDNGKIVPINSGEISVRQMI